MDNGLLQSEQPAPAKDHDVLILIVMDNGLLREITGTYTTLHDAVLILIVMDNGLLLVKKDGGRYAGSS